eukprot:COSAG04_NODE_482_length_13604_cov_19.290707_8_plen_1020_part_00
MPNAVSEWLSRYKEDADEAILELINLILEVAECTGTLGELPEGEDAIGEVVEDLTNDHFEDAAPDYLVNNNTKAKKKQRQNFHELWNKILVQGSNTVIGSEENLSPVMIEWLIKLASSEARPLRHTATIVALEWLEACIDVANGSKKDLGVAQRQLQAEKKKKKKVNASKVSQLDNRSDVLSENVALLETTMKDVFNGVFVHRYRDVSDKIRVLCLDKIGRFILEYPSVFLQDNYLKYLGWQLYDKSNDVRSACVTAVSRLYENPENAPNLDLFTTRFKDRMLELQLDVDPGVSAAGMQLSTALLRNEILEAEEIGDTLAGLKHADPKIRKAASTFVRSYMDMSIDSSSIDDPELAFQQLKVLLNICESDEDDDRSYIWVADSMADVAAALRDWKAMVDLLLDDSSGLDEAAQRRLVGLMVCSIKKACGVAISADTAPKLTKRQKDAIPEHKHELTNNFMLALPKLMERFQADEAIMCELVEIPAHMDVSQYAAARKKKALTDLVKHLRVAYMKHSDSELLLHVAGAFRTLTSADFALNKDCKSALDKLRDALIADLGRQADQVLRGEAEDQEAAEYSLEIVLRRLNGLYEQVDARSPETLQAVKACLTTGADEEEELSDTVCVRALNILHKHCMWDIMGLSKAEGRLEAELESVSSRRDSVIEQLISLENASPVVRLEAFKILMDTLVLYATSAATADSGMDFTVSSEVVDKVVAWFEREMRSDGFESAHELSYVKAITHGVLGGGLPSESVAPVVVAHYVKHGKDCESHIKLFMQTLKKKLSKTGVWSVELGAMQRLFGQYVEKDEEEIYHDLQLLVEKVAQAHPPMMKDRTALFNVIKGGIAYGLEEAPRNVLFLEVAVMTLASKFTAEQKNKIHQVLQEKMSAAGLAADEDHEDWNSYFALEKQLLEKSRSRSATKSGSRRALQPLLDDEPAQSDEDDMDVVGSADDGGTQGRGSKRRSHERDDEVSEEEEQEEEQEEEEAGSSAGFQKKLRSKPAVPGRGSGFRKRRRRSASSQ